MTHTQRRLLTLSNPIFAGVTLPYTLDPSTLEDGPFPAGWTAPNWTISANKGVCSPTLGTELLTDPGLEANYTAGKCDTLAVYAGVSVAQSADVHGGSKAQQFQGTEFAGQLYFPTITPEANAWYLASGWGKRTAGTAVDVHMTLNQMNGFHFSGSISPRYFMEAAYVQRKLATISNSVTAITLIALWNETAGASDTVIGDDYSLKKITAGSMFALRKAKADITSKAKYTWNRDGVCGVVARANSANSPTTFLIAYYLNYAHTLFFCELDKCVNGVYTQLISSLIGSTMPTPSQYLEIRCSGSTVKLYFNDAQVGTDQTVSDVAGVYAGVFQSGGDQLEGYTVS